MKTNNAILIGAALAVAGYFAYRYFRKKQEQNNENGSRKYRQKENGSSQDSTGFTAYQKKVMTLQQKLAIHVDGDPGRGPNSQTNKAVASNYPSLYAKLGIVSPTNVDQYIAAKKENLSDKARLDQVWNAMGQGTPAKLIRDTHVSAFYLDKSDNKYYPTGGGFIVKQGTSIYKSTSVLLTNGIFTTIPVYGVNSGDFIGNRGVRLDANTLYVP